MITTITLQDAEGNDVTLHGGTTTRYCTDATGLLSTGQPRENRRTNPTGRGAIDQTRWTDGLVIPLAFEIMGTSAVNAIAEYRTVKKAITETLATERGALMKWTEGGSGLQLQRRVKLAGDLNPPIVSSAALVSFQAQFFAEDDRAYSQTLQTFTGIPASDAAGGMTMPFTFPVLFAPSGGGTVSVTNSGREPAPARFRFYGGCSNPQMVNLDSGDRLVLNGDVPAGDFWELDTATGSVVAGSDGSSRDQFLDPELSRWFEIPAATASTPTTSLQMLAENYDGDAYPEVLLRAAY